MSWLLAIALAVVALATAVLLFRTARQGWTMIAAALALGLAGYAWQASPGLSGAPAVPANADSELGWALVEARQAMVAEDDRSRSPKLLSADAYARNGRYADAATLLRGAVADDPNDADAWLALGNALVEHAEGALTPPALLAYRRAEAADPDAAGPGYFMGLSLIRQGRPDEARDIWRATLAQAAPDAAGREQLTGLLARLEGELRASAPGGQAGR